jgi:hypothetical protein
MLVVLSPAAVASNNVMDEVAFALDEGKTVIPVLREECRIPFRLRRVQYIDFKSDYPAGLEALLRTLVPEHPVSRLRPGDKPCAGEPPAVVTDPQRLRMESAIYNRARPRDQWIAISLADFLQADDPREKAALIAVLKSLADSKLLLLGKWNQLGAHKIYPSGLTDDEMFCQGSFEIMATTQSAPNFKRRLRSRDPRNNRPGD